MKTRTPSIILILYFSSRVYIWKKKKKKRKSDKSIVDVEILNTAWKQVSKMKYE